MTNLVTQLRDAGRNCTRGVLVPLALFTSTLGLGASHSWETDARGANQTLQADTIFLATLYWDLIRPFTAYSQGEWIPLSHYEPPPELATVESDWYGRSSSGEALTLEDLRVVRVSDGLSWYGGEWALTADSDMGVAEYDDYAYRGTEPGGVFATASAPITQVVEVSPEGAEARDIAVVLEGLFDELEMDPPPLAEYPTAPTTAVERAQSPIYTTRFQKVSISPALDIFLHRARRQYGDCVGVSAGHGFADMESWIIRRAGELRLISARVDPTNCVEKTAFSTALHGSVELDEEIYLVIEGYGYEGSSRGIRQLVGDSLVTVGGPRFP